MDIAKGGTIAENRRARFDYSVEEVIEAGVELEGQEVKSAKVGRMGLSGSYAIVRGGELWLLNAQIPPYQQNNTPKEYDPARTRKLLVSKSQLAHISGRLDAKGVSCVPLRAFVSRGLVKIELALARSRKKEDKREYIKSREHTREMRQNLG